MEIREPTPDEVGHYDRNGWVKLERFVAPELAAELLERIQAKMGLDAGRAGADGRASTPNLDSGKLQALWQPWDLPSREDEVLYEFSHSVGIGRAASRLLRGRAARWYSDAVYAKLPAARTGSKTPWHQDFPYHAFDRVGMMNIWIALVDIPPEKGTMRFLSGSHRAGPLGRFVHRGDDVDMVAHYPELLDEYEVSPPLHLRPGDATVHNMCLVHSAPENATDDVRWVYAVSAFPADALYTGAANRRTDGLGLEINKPFDHPNFPLLPAAS